MPGHILPRAFATGRSASLLVPLMVLAACDGGDAGVKVFNDDPYAEILNPEHESTVDPNTPITMLGSVSDTETASVDLLVTWLVDGEVVCDSVNPDAAGNTECLTEFDPGSHTIELIVTDSGGLNYKADASILVEATNAPSVDINLPMSGAVYYADRATTLEGLVSDAEDSPESLAIAWSSDLQGDLGVTASASSSGLATGEVTLDPGEHEIKLTATDSDGLEGFDVVAITVVATNTPPSCGITSPVDGSYDDAGATVEFEAVASDADVDSVVLEAVWRSDRDGELYTNNVSAAGESTFSTDALTVGTHLITLTVTDDAGDPCTDTITYTVGSPPLVAITLPGDGDVVNEGDLVTFEGTVTDSEDVGVDLIVSWTSDIDGTLDTSPPPGDGSGTVGFVTDELSAGEHSIRLRGTDGDGLYSDATISFTVNGLPSAPVISIDPATPDTTNDLLVSVDVDSLDPEGGSVSYGYDWTVDGVPSGVTSSTVPASATTRGEVWAVTVTPFDGLGTGAFATASVTIENSPPEVVGAPSLGPDPVYEGQSLTCTLDSTSDADGDSVTSSVSWIVNGASVSATSTTLGSTFFDAGDTVYCVQTPNDGIENGTGVSSNVVTVANTAPEVTNVSISPDPADAGDSLSCTYSYSDADGHSDSSTIGWTVNGASAGTGSTLSSGYVRGDTVTCSVTANDGYDDGNTDTDSITIENSPPEITSVSVTPDPSTTSDDYTCTVSGYTDADGDSVSYVYAWYVNGSSVGVAADTLSASMHGKNDTVFCRVYANDGYDNGASEDSNTVTTGNTAPVVSSVTLSPSSPGTAVDIVATVSTSDADSDTVSNTYEWFVNGTSVVSGSSATLDSSYFVRGDDVYVEVTPNDGDDDGSTLSSSSVTIQNTLPSAPSLAFNPSAPEQELDDLYCEVTTAAADPDGDSISYTFSWTYDGIAYTGATTTTYTGDTVPAADTVLGFDWICTATPNDGYGDGTAESKLVTVIDVIDPDAPTISTPDRFRNEDDITISGTCEYGDCVDVVVDCSSASLQQDSTVSCGSGDTWTASFSGLIRDETTLCTAYCVDASANESADSNTVSTDVCAPEDTYEDSSGTGDSDATAIDAWSAIAEGSSASISGNILTTDTVDWYVVDSDDDLAADRSATYDFYSLDIRLLDPDTGNESTVYDMVVYRGSVATASCASSGSYTAYTDYWYDSGDGSHTPPSDRRRCSSSSASYNTCEDMSDTYYIKVERVSASVTSCAGYTVSVTNNGGVCNTTTECPNN